MGSQLLEQQEEWQLERRRFFSEATMAKIPDPEEPLELMGGDQAEQACLVEAHRRVPRTVRSAQEDPLPKAVLAFCPHMAILDVLEPVD